MFVEPLKYLFSIPLGGFYLNIQEIGFLFFTYGYYKSGPDLSTGVGRGIVRLSWVVLGVICCSEFFKMLQFSGGLREVIRVNRILEPGLFSLFILGLGARPGARFVVPYAFLAILISASLSVGFGLVGIRPVNPFVAQDPTIFSTAENTAPMGRFGGAASSLGIFFLLLLYFIGSMRRSFKLQFKWQLVIILASICAIGVMAGSFNRTMMIGSFLSVVVVSCFHFRFKSAILGAIGVLAFLGFGWALIQNDSEVERQFRQRILVITQGQDAVLENVYYGGRAEIFEQVGQRIKEYPAMGLPYGVPAFMLQRDFAVQYLFYTDISVVNVFLRYGLIATALVVLIYLLLIFRSYQNRKLFPPGELYALNLSLFYSLIIYSLVSLNFDIFLKHPAGLFLVLVNTHILFYSEVSLRKGSKLVRLPQNRFR
jgi:hypothetical protein